MNTKNLRISPFLIPIIMLLHMIALTGCNMDIDSEPQHLLVDNTHGYYFDVYTDSAKDKDRLGIIELREYNDEIFFKVENAGQQRQFSVQIYIDCKQVPIKINNTEYDTYLIDASENFAQEFAFQLAEPMDTEYNHSLVAILTAGSDLLTNEVDFEMSDSYSIAIDHLLSFDENNSMIQSEYEMEETKIVTEYQSSGLLLNTDTIHFERTIPNRELQVSVHEKIALQYQTGGYEDCEEVAIIITIGSEQAKLNNQEYILCKVDNGELVRGILNINAPHQEGNYEVMSWVIKDPFDFDKSERLPLDSSYRFTLNVE